MEELILSGSRRQRAGGGMAHTERPLRESRTLRLALSDGVWSVVAEREAPIDAEANVGPGPMGGVVLIQLAPERTPVGPPSASRIAGALRCVDAELGLGLGELEAGPEGPG